MNFQLLKVGSTKEKHLAHNTHYVHWLADVHAGSFAPAFTLSFHNCECSCKPPMPRIKVFMANSIKRKQRKT